MDNFDCVSVGYLDRLHSRHHECNRAKDFRIWAGEMIMELKDLIFGIFISTLFAVLWASVCYIFKVHQLVAVSVGSVIGVVAAQGGMYWSANKNGSHK